MVSIGHIIIWFPEFPNEVYYATRVGNMIIWFFCENLSCDFSMESNGNKLMFEMFFSFRFLIACN